MIFLTLDGLYLSTQGRVTGIGSWLLEAAEVEGADSFLIKDVDGAGSGSGSGLIIFLTEAAFWVLLGVAAFPLAFLVDGGDDPALLPGLVAIIWRKSSSLMTGRFSSLAYPKGKKQSNVINDG